MAEAPETIEGWWVLHDVRRVDWAQWRRLSPAQREAIIGEAQAYFAHSDAINGTGDGAFALYQVITQKGDLETLHFRPQAGMLFDIQNEMAKLQLNDFLQPAYAYFSIIELSRYNDVSDDPLRNPALAARLHHEIPATAYNCFYPMNKRRGERVNWYDTDVEERRALMRGHGMIGRKYADRVTQIVTGSQGLDDWEWGVTLFADDPLYFKKLIYEMRFDPASSRYAEFGPFYIGRRMRVQQLATFLALPRNQDGPQAQGL
ncbi:MAG: heme-dependent peroxidase [Firmicutes bacterium]|nr:heme-dependent peroxidase [Bacillota bacterium]